MSFRLSLQVEPIYYANEYRLVGAFHYRWDVDGVKYRDEISVLESLIK